MKDCFCHPEICELKFIFMNEYKIAHCLTRHDEEKYGTWSGMLGKPSKELLSQFGWAPPIAPESLILTCGPDGFKE